MLERGVRVLRAFRPPDGTLTLPALITRTGLPKPTVYRLAEALVELGLLERQRTGYSPGIALFELGELVPAKLRLRETALPYMQDLYEATHETVHLGVLDDLDVVYAEKIRGHSGVDVPSRVGGRLPLSSTGVGKALLAFAPADVIDAVLSRPLRPLTAYSITDPAVLSDQLTEIRATRLAYDREEAALAVSCVAAPVLIGVDVVAAISLAVPAAQFQPVRLAAAVHTVSIALSRLLSRGSVGAPGPRG
jgi:DNA-binding IclR family transcriptional regulator